MKKISMILAAFVLALGLTQCKKEEAPTTTAEENGYRITLDLGSSTRANVDPEHPGTDGTNYWAPVTFETGDIIYVGYKGNYVGTLSYGSSGKFNGTLNAETLNNIGIDGESKLHFYLLGGKGFTPTQDGNTFTVDISDQTSGYPVIAYDDSDEAFTVACTTYTAKLKNKASIMKFNVTKPTNANDAICIEGMNNVVSIDFTNIADNDDNGFSYSMDATNNGLIKMPGVSGSPAEMWAIVLPQSAVTEKTNYAYNENGDWSGARPAIPAITPNQYLDDGVNIAIYYKGFTIQSTPLKRVYFSPGNLQYKASTNTWRFAQHQWDYIGSQSPDNNGNTGGNVYGSDNLNIGEEYNGWIDLFGWGTSGYDDEHEGYFRPWDTESSTKGKGYGPYANGQYNLGLDNTNHDWGVYNKNRIYYGEGYLVHDWHTLKYEQWNYVANSRILAGVINPNANQPTQGYHTYTLATVNGTPGVILFPDNWIGKIDGISVNINYREETTGITYKSNILDDTAWDKLQNAGAVFLPAAGWRYIKTRLYDFGKDGHYWSTDSRVSGGYYYGWSMHFNENIFEKINTRVRYYGCSVRLVYDIN